MAQFWWSEPHLSTSQPAAIHQAATRGHSKLSAKTMERFLLMWSALVQTSPSEQHELSTVLLEHDRIYWIVSRWAANTATCWTAIEFNNMRHHPKPPLTSARTECYPYFPINSGSGKTTGLTNRSAESSQLQPKATRALNWTNPEKQTKLSAPKIRA